MNRLSITAFGRQLIQTQDLDPVYVALNNTGWSRAQKLRWLTAYIAFYHCGAACYMSEYRADEFWSLMLGAAENTELATPYGDRWPRSSERRHFRGMQAVRAVQDWEQRYPEPEQLFEDIASGPTDFASVAARALQLRSVGAWLSFKVVDLVDACLGAPVDQSDVRPFLYDTPRAGLLLAWDKHIGPQCQRTPRDEDQKLTWCLTYLRRQFEDLTIPHKPGRPIDMFCLETVACKWKSHMGGHYPLGKDTREIRHGLEPWLPHSKAARRFLKVMPPLVV